MICRKCGYRNDFLKECPFHEPHVSERIKAIRERKQKEALAEDIKNAEQQVQVIRTADSPQRRKNVLRRKDYRRCFDV